MHQRITVKNLSCQNCVKHVTEHFLALQGVKSVRVDLAQQEVEVVTEVEHSLLDYQTSLADTVYEAVAFV